MRTRALFALVALFALCAPAAQAQAPAGQTPNPQRDAVREQVRATLTTFAPTLGMTFHQSTKQPYNFGGTLTSGLTYSDELEIVVVVGSQKTLGVEVYPHYKGGYINLKKARDPDTLAARLLRLNNDGFFYWSADEQYDLHVDFNFTLESGYPEAAFRTVLESVHNLDKVVGDLRPLIDGGT
jgi:hypothetical protein